MGFSDAIRAGFQNYANFRGRAPRSEFWYWTLFVVLASIVLGILDVLIFGTDSMRPLSGLFGLAVLLPGIAVSVRRLHDIGRSGWWLFLILIPLVGAIILLIWYITRSQPGANLYGPNPFGE